MLSQAEIDALLGAVNTGQVEALIGEAAEPRRPARTARTYDFRRPNKFSKDQIRTLQAVHENMARLTAARLQALLRMPVSMQLADAEQMLFDEYVQGLTLPTQLAVLATDGLGGPFLLDLDLPLAFALVDRLLGGPGRIPAERREPTSIEADLIGRVIRDLISPLDEAWSHLQQLQTHVTELALGPALLRVAAPSAVTATLTFEMRLGGQTAPVSICYPHATLEPLLPRLSATAWYAQPVRSSTSTAYREDLEACLMEAEIPVRVVLDGIELPVEALASLQPGDVIRMDDRVGQPIAMTIADGPRLWGVPGRVGDRLALQIARPLRSVEE